jgi:hypothetical protein
MKFLPLALTSSVMMTVCASANLPVSRTTEVLPISQTAGRQYYMTIPYSAEIVHRSTVAGVSTNTLTLATAMPTLTGDHTARVVSGIHRGKYFAINEATSSGTTLNLISFSTSGVSLTNNVDEIEIVRDFTLGTLFPGGANFAKNVDPNLACNVKFYVGAALRTFFYDTTKWQRLDTSADASNVTIPYGTAIYVLPRVNATQYVSGVRNSVMGAVSRTAGQTRLYSNPWAKTITLADMTAFVVKNADANLADQVLLYTNVGALRRYFHNGASWQLVGGSNVDGSTITFPAGRGFGLTSRATSFFTFPEYP